MTAPGHQSFIGMRSFVSAKPTTSCLPENPRPVPTMTMAQYAARENARMRGHGVGSQAYRVNYATSLTDQRIAFEQEVMLIINGTEWISSDGIWLKLKMSGSDAPKSRVVELMTRLSKRGVVERRWCNTNGSRHYIYRGRK